MKERPIIFNDAMVRAVLDGRKTQTRRPVKGQISLLGGVARWIYGKKIVSGGLDEILRAMAFHHCPFGQPGDRLWVREAFQPLLADGIGEDEWREKINYKTGEGFKVSYRATDGIKDFYSLANDNPFCSRVTPSIHMPRWASRITLEVTAVRVERLQDISEDDATSEGVECYPEGWVDYLMPYTQCCGSPSDSFATLWQSIYGAESWQSNPWVWVVEFRRVEQ